MTDIVHVDAHTREGGKVDVIQHYRGLPNNGASAHMTEAEYNYAKKLYISKIISLYGECNGARTREEQIIINNANNIISNFKIECAKNLLKEAIRFEEKARNLDQDEDYRAIRKINDIAYENDEALFATMSDWFVFGDGKPYIFTPEEEKQIFNQRMVKETTNKIEESFIMRISGVTPFGKNKKFNSIKEENNFIKKIIEKHLPKDTKLTGNEIWNEKIKNLKVGETMEFNNITIGDYFTSEGMIVKGYFKDFFPNYPREFNKRFIEKNNLDFFAREAAKTPYAQTIFTLGSGQIKSTFSGKITRNKHFFDVSYNVIHRISDRYDFNNESASSKD